MKGKRAFWGIGAAAAVLLIGIAAGCAAFLRPMEQAAVEQLTKSITYANGQFIFQIPAGLENPKELHLHAAGRAEYGGGFSASLHFLEEANGNWQPGQVYSIPYDPAYTELTLDIAYEGQEGTIDLLDYVK